MKIILFISICLLFSCVSEPRQEKRKETQQKIKIYTKYSSEKNKYVNFNSTKAINKIADIENEYFQNWEKGVSRYYGTIWREKAETYIKNDTSQYESYLNTLRPKIGKPDSLHCTIYAYKGLTAGMDTAQLLKLKQHHKAIWKSREIAGWSIGYILVKYFDWDAYLIIDSNSVEFNHCMKSYQKNKAYPVWRQPNIPLKEVFIIGKQEELINKLLLNNEFGWGFSEQGIHTWLTRFDDLKECNWSGAPSKKYQQAEYERPLFISTKFSNYYDYDSHVIIFPK